MSRGGAGDSTTMRCRRESRRVRKMVQRGAGMEPAQAGVEEGLEAWARKRVAEKHWARSLDRRERI